jgi:hypothetical protein
MMDGNTRDESKRAHSVPRNDDQIDTEISAENGQMKKQGLSVDASPFNPVKLELGYLLLIGILLFIVIHRLSDNLLQQVTILFIYGLISMLWLVARIRKVTRQQQAGSKPLAEDKE